MKLKRADFVHAVKVGDDMRHSVDAERHGVPMLVKVTPGGTEYVQMGADCIPMAWVTKFEAYEDGPGMAKAEQQGKGAK